MGADRRRSKDYCAGAGVGRPGPTAWAKQGLDRWIDARAAHRIAGLPTVVRSGERMSAAGPSVRVTRLLAVLLGSALGAAAVGGVVHWWPTFEHGSEVCVRCGVEREVDRKGPLRSYSDPRPSRLRAWMEADISECAEHSWMRSGCWIGSRGTARYGWVLP